MSVTRPSINNSGRQLAALKRALNRGPKLPHKQLPTYVAAMALRWGLTSEKTAGRWITMTTVLRDGSNDAFSGRVRGA